MIFGIQLKSEKEESFEVEFIDKTANNHADFAQAQRKQLLK